MKIILTSLAVFFILIHTANAVKFYISPLGNNSNSGTTSSTAFLTIDKGVNSAANYDTVVALAGTYAISAAINITKPITLLSQGAQIDGGLWSPTIQNKRLLLISNTNDVLIDGFVFKNLIGDFSIGIAIIGSGRNITVQHCMITNIGWTNNNLSAIPSGGNNANGILVMGSSSISLSQINIMYDTVTNCALGYSEALTVVGNVDTFKITDNFIYANSNIGIDCAGSKTFTNAPLSVNYARNGRIANNVVTRCMSPVAISAGIYLDGAYNCVVEANILSENAVGISLGQESSVSAGAKPCSQNKIINNIIYKNAVAGVVWGDNFGSSSKVINNAFYNNTLYKNRTGNIINGVTSIGGTPAGTGSNEYGNIFGGEILIHSCDSSFFDNNILFPLGLRHCVVVPDAYIAKHLLFNYNNFNRDNNNVSYFDIGAGASANGIAGVQTFYTTSVTDLYINTTTGYPNFVDTLNSNFRMQISPLSNCIDAGNIAATTSSISLTDFDGNPRIYGNRIDIGAFESQTTLSIESSTMSRAATPFEVEIYPNPNAGYFSIKTTELLTRIIVSDLAGHSVYQSVKPLEQIHLMNLPAGVYQVSFFSVSGSVLNKKIAKW